MSAPTFDRASGIGGSDVAAVLGISPWRSKWDVWLEKTNDPAHHPQTATAAMDFGNMVEPVLAKAYERDHPGAAIRLFGGAHSEPIWHPNHIMYMHKDGLISGVEDGLWEGKSTRTDRDWQGGVPEYYKAQVHAYLAISGEPWCDITVLFRDTAEFAHYRIVADDALQAGIVSACEAFWAEHVLTRTPPKMDASDAAARYLSGRFPAEKTGDALPYDPTFAGAVTGLIATRDALARLQADEALLVNTLKAQMGEYPRADGEGWRITWKRAKGFDKTNWQEVAGALRGLLFQTRTSLLAGRTEEALGILTNNDPETIIGHSTRTTEGSRPFVLKTAKDT